MTTTPASPRSANVQRAATDSAAHTADLASWRVEGFGILRIIFGVVWAIDAAFKWLPGFHSNFEDYLNGGAEGQPAIIQSWINFWVKTVNVNTHVFAYLTAVGETALASALLFGVFSNLAYAGGTLLSLGIWTTAEGFGGPYKAGSVDIGAAIIYVLVFVALFLTNAGLHFGLDQRLTPALGRWGWLASGPSRQLRTSRGADGAPGIAMERRDR